MFSGLMAGRGYLKSGWKYQPRLVVKTDRGDKVMRELVNRADLQNVRFTDVFIPNRNLPELSMQPYILERVTMLYGDMLDDNKEEEYWNGDYLKKIKASKNFSRNLSYGADLPVDDDTQRKEIIRGQYINMICMHTMDGEKFYTLEGGDNDWILNKKTENEYWHGHYPLIDFAPFPEDDEFFSMGIVQPVADLQIALSSSINQLLTNARKAGNPMWIAGKAASQTPDWAFVNKPDGVIRVVGDVNQVQPVKTIDTSETLLSLRTTLQTSIERTTSISSLYSSGVSSTGEVNKTATGAKIIDQNIDQNLQLLISLFGAQILKQAGEHFLELNVQYVTEDQVIEVSGPKGAVDFKTITPDQVSSNFKVRVSPERMLKQSPVVKQSSLLNLYSTLKDSPHLNRVEMEKMIVDAYPESEESESPLIIDPEDKAKDVIKMIVGGVEPTKPKVNEDLETIMNIIQLDLLENQYDDATLLAFEKYISQIKLTIEAKNKNLVVKPAPEPQLLPTDPQSLAQGMGAQVAPPVNPTEGLPAGITQNQLGL